MMKTDSIGKTGKHSEFCEGHVTCPVTGKEECVGKDLAKARLLMPLKFSRIEQRVRDVENKLTKLSDNISEFVSVLKMALIPDQSGKMTSQLVEEQKYS